MDQSGGCDTRASDSRGWCGPGGRSWERRGLDSRAALTQGRPPGSREVTPKDADPARPSSIYTCKCCRREKPHPSHCA